GLQRPPLGPLRRRPADRRPPRDALPPRAALVVSDLRPGLPALLAGIDPAGRARPGRLRAGRRAPRPRQGTRELQVQPRVRIDRAGGGSGGLSGGDPALAGRMAPDARTSARGSAAGRSAHSRPRLLPPATMVRAALGRAAHRGVVPIQEWAVWRSWVLVLTSLALGLPVVSHASDGEAASGAPARPQAGSDGGVQDAFHYKRLIRGGLNPGKALKTARSGHMGLTRPPEALPL